MQAFTVSIGHGEDFSFQAWVKRVAKRENTGKRRKRKALRNGETRQKLSGGSFQYLRQKPAGKKKRGKWSAPLQKRGGTKR